MLFNVFSLVNTWHALGFSVFLMVDTLTFTTADSVSPYYGTNQLIMCELFLISFLWH